MVTLKIDDETFAALHKQAGARGLTVEAWLKDKTFAAEAYEAPAEPSPESGEGWHDRLKGFIALHHPTGAPLDDSRESIYD